MSDNFEDQMDSLMERASGLAHGPSEIALLEEAVRLSDSHQRDDYGFDLRKRLMQAATFGGAPEKALVAFTWCIAQCDREPEEFDSGELLWEYKWVVSGLKQFPQISLSQIESAMDDMTRRYEENGLSSKPIYKLRALHAMHRGDLEDCRKWQRQWRKTDSGYGNDCDACERHDQVEFMVFVGKDERAIEMADPILNNRMRCAEIPHLTYALLLLPYLHLGQFDEAFIAHQQGYRIIADNREFLSSIGDHLTYLTLTGNYHLALPMFANHLEWFLETTSLLRRFQFDKGVLFLLQEYARENSKPINLSLPRNFPLFRQDDTYSAEELRAWFENDAREIAKKFDTRNGTDYFHRQIEELPELRQWATDYPIE